MKGVEPHAYRMVWVYPIVCPHIPSRHQAPGIVVLVQAFFVSRIEIIVIGIVDGILDGMVDVEACGHIQIFLLHVEIEASVLGIVFTLNVLDIETSLHAVVLVFLEFYVDNARIAGVPQSGSRIRYDFDLSDIFCGDTPQIGIHGFGRNIGFPSVDI